MKILRAHNYYRRANPSGENSVFDAEGALLRANGYVLKDFTEESDSLAMRGGISKAASYISIPWNSASRQRFELAIREFKPDVIHVHNTFPLLSPSIFWANRGQIPLVLTLHNYRTLCPAGIPARGGTSCTECIDRKTALPSIIHGCYRDSRLATLPLAGTVALHRALQTWSKRVDCHIALTDFQRDILIRGGLPADSIVVRPNHQPGTPRVIEWSRRNSDILFVGRISQEKGVPTLLKAWRGIPQQIKCGRLLRIVGDGPDLGKLKAEYGDPDVEFTGLVAPELASNLISEASTLVIPSEWFEGFPVVLREALAYGTPTIVSDVGDMGNLITSHEAGLSFPAGHTKSLAECISMSIQHPDLLRSFSQNAHNYYLNFLSERGGLDSLLRIYTQQIARSKGR